MITPEVPADSPPRSTVGRALWWAYERAPGGCDAVYRLGRRYVMPVLRHRLPVQRLTGPAAGGGSRATLIATGSAMTLDLLVARFFDGRPEVEPMGSVPLLRLPRVLDRLAPTADLTLACVPRAFAGWFGERYLRVPALVGAWLPLGATTEATLAQATKSVRYDVRRALAKGYGWTFSREPADFERFHDEYYGPSVRARFGPLAVVRERAVLRRHFRHRGGLIWLHRGGDTVAGELVRGHGRRLRSLVAGVHPSRHDSPDPSPQFALNLATCDIAVRQGFAEIDFGGSIPSLQDGVLRSKRAWGAVLASWEESHRDILVRWPAALPAAVRRLLHAVPLLFESPNGLCAVAAAEPGQPTDARAAGELWRRRAPRGLRRLCLIGAEAPARLAPDGRPAPDGPVLLCPAGDAASINGAAARAA